MTSNMNSKAVQAADDAVKRAATAEPPRSYSLWSSPFIVGNLREMITSAKSERLMIESDKEKIPVPTYHSRDSLLVHINKLNKIIEIRDDVIKQRDDEILLCKTELQEKNDLVDELMHQLQLERRALGWTLGSAFTEKQYRVTRRRGRERQHGPFFTDYINAYDG